MPNPTYSTVVGIGKEAVAGQPAVPATFLPAKQFTPKDNTALLPDEGWRGSAVKTYGHMPGVMSVEYDFAGDVYADIIGFPLAGVLGDVVVTGSAAPYTHGMAVNNAGQQQPATYTITDFNGVSTLQYPGLHFTEVSLKFAGDKSLDYTAKAVGFPSAPGTKPTPSYSGLPLIAGWTGVVQLGGATVAYVLDGEISIKRGGEAIRNVNGSQAPYSIWSDALEVTGKLTCVMEADTLRQSYVAGTSTSLDVNFAAGTGATATGVRAHCSKIFLDSADINRGKSYVELGLAFTADGNVADALAGGSGGYTPIQVNVTNANPTGTYK
ncbi:hypothetical protein KGQ19_18190 [Catenulispora sp. NL8]|uniref:Uncharacterized protein n=1 Tax=Catenulispora pinistramenti TaxID=2705254 RepID=A0ABS5KS04_9ACTN|nr:phage tail tube protein [Catenulispora pinistramenti]MBS2548799.1 hypothetical protein [Catenulispora pinistramenti]